MAIFALKKKVDFYCHQDTPTCIHVLSSCKKNLFYRVNHRTLVKKLLLSVILIGTCTHTRRHGAMILPVIMRDTHTRRHGAMILPVILIGT